MVRPTSADEHVSTVDADLHRERWIGVDEPPQGPQHPALVVLARLRHSRSEEELAAVAVQVGGEQGHSLAIEAGLCPLESSRARRRRPRRAPGRRAGRRCRRSGRRRWWPRDAPGRGDRDRGSPPGPGGRARECAPRRGRIGSPRPAGGADGASRRRSSAPSARGRVEPRGSRAAVAGVTTICPASAVFSASAVAVAAGPSTRSSRVGSPTRNRWMSPEWMPTDIDSLSRPTDVGTAAASRKRHPHLDGRVARAHGVVVASEEEQERIAAELEEVRAPRPRRCRACRRTPGSASRRSPPRRSGPSSTASRSAP